MAEEQQRQQRGAVYMVTGGCGFLGRHIVKLLLQKEDHLREIRVFDKTPDMSLADLGTEKTNVVVIQGDITDYSSLLEASRGVALCIHTASLVDCWYKFPKELVYSINVTGTENVINACVECDIQCLLYTSSMEVIGPNVKAGHFVRGNEDTPYNVSHTMAYPVSKEKAEQTVLRANGIKLKGGKCLATSVLRPTGIYGEGFLLLKEMYQNAVAAGGLIISGIPHTTEHGRVHVGNVAWMHVLAARALRERPQKIGGEVFYCYDDSPYKSYEDFNMIFLSRFNFRLVRLPLLLLWILAMFNDVFRWLMTPFFKYTPILNRFTLSLAITSFTVATDKAQRYFGYRPLYDWDHCRAEMEKWVDTFPTEKTKDS